MRRFMFTFYLSLISTISVVVALTFNREEVILDLSLVYKVSKRNSEFYWRNYTGETPSDAVPGGKDKDGLTTYIGRAIHTNGALVPGQIYTTERKLFYYYIKAGYGVDKNVKILCSKHPEKFEWIQTNVGNAKFLTGKRLVPGGFDDGYPLLIGRSNIGREKAVGKFTIYYKYCGFAYATKDDAGREDGECEILSYNP